MGSISVVSGDRVLLDVSAFLGDPNSGFGIAIFVNDNYQDMFLDGGGVINTTLVVANVTGSTAYTVSSTGTHTFKIGYFRYHDAGGGIWYINNRSDGNNFAGKMVTKLIASVYR